MMSVMMVMAVMKLTLIVNIIFIMARFERTEKEVEGGDIGQGRTREGEGRVGLILARKREMLILIR